MNGSGSPSPQRPWWTSTSPSAMVASASASLSSSPPPVIATYRYGATPASDRKGKMKESFGSVPIRQLPTELLSHIFAHLPPSALNAAQLVCRHWHQVISDEASWRSAFETYYGIVGPQGLALGRRIEPASWKAEYRSRVSLLHRWSKSRTPALTHNPNLGPLSSMHIIFPTSTISQQSLKSSHGTSSPRVAPHLSPTLLSLSEALGAAVQSTPFTGKVTRGMLHATPVDNLGRPFGFAPVQVTSSVIAPDGARIVFGMADGTIRIVSCGQGRGVVAGVGERGEVRAIQNAHREGTDVVAVAFGRPGARTRADVFVSVGQDGRVVVWQLSSSTATRDRPAPATKIWSTRVDAAIRATGSTETRVGSEPPSVTAVAFDPGWSGRQGRKAAIAIGLTTGSVLSWTDVDLDLGDVVSVETHSSHELASGSMTAVDVLHFDYVSLSNSYRLLVHAKDQADFSRFAFEPSTLSPPTRVVFKHPFKHLGTLTAFAFDFEEPPTALMDSVTPKEGRITGFTPNDPSTPVTEDLPTSSSKASLASLAASETRSSFDGAFENGDSHATIFNPRASYFGRRKFVVAGDAQGRVHVWDWDVEIDDSASDSNVGVDPHKTIDTSESRITALELSGAVLFVGSLDGTVRCYDAVTSTLLRTFKDRTAPRMPARMLAAGQFDASDEERWKVSHIRASRDAVVAAIGNRVLAWRVSSDLGKKKAKGGVTGVGGRMSARTERFRSGLELRSEIKDSIDSLSNESADRVQRLENEHRIAANYGLPASLDNMTEQEAVALALMLSAEEEESRWFSDSARSSAATSPAFEPVPEELLDMEGLSLDANEVAYERPSRAFGNRRPSSSLAYEFEDWDDDDDDDVDDDVSRLSPGNARSVSLSVPTSPTLRGSSLSNGSPSPSSRSTSYTWRPASLSPQHASPSFSSYHLSSSSPHAKVQLSPRLDPTYGSAGSSIPSGSVPDMSAELWPVASSSTSSPPTGAAGTPAKRPSPSPSTSPSPLPTPPPATMMKRGWNVVARAGSASPSASPSPTVWSSARTGSSNPSPVSGASPGRTSLLTEQLRASSGSTTTSSSMDQALARGIQQSREEELRKREEQEIRFAIELSLAEEASKAGS